jgi:hypothetical protein
MFGWFNKKIEQNTELQTADELFKDDKGKSINSCEKCPLKYACTGKKEKTENCEYAMDVSDIDFSKDVILIIDDNNGVVSFLEDDMEYYKEEGIISEDTQVLSISGAYAAFTLELLMTKIKNINIKYAIIDITLGGSRHSKEGNVKYTGVDVFRIIYEINPDVKYLFYTGNNLNPYIKSNEVLMTKYKELTKKDIKDSVLYKTSIDMDSRRKFIAEYLFGDNKK